MLQLRQNRQKTFRNMPSLNWIGKEVVDWPVLPLFSRLMKSSFLKNYREVPVDILEDAVQLAALTPKAARP